MKPTGLAPFSLKNTPALIRTGLFRRRRSVSNRKRSVRLGRGKHLRHSASYWKGRKPLVLVRATVLASLLPATNDYDADLGMFELLMRMDNEGIWRRTPKITVDHVWRSSAVSAERKARHITVDGGTSPPSWIGIPKTLSKQAAAAIQAERAEMMRLSLPEVPFSEKVNTAERAEEVEDLASSDDPFYEGVWDRVNAYYGTNAHNAS